MAHNKVDDERIENTDYVFRKAGYLRDTLLLRTGDNTRPLLPFCSVPSLVFTRFHALMFRKSAGTPQNNNKKTITLAFQLMGASKLIDNSNRSSTHTA